MEENKNIEIQEKECDFCSKNGKKAVVSVVICGLLTILALFYAVMTIITACEYLVAVKAENAGEQLGNAIGAVLILPFSLMFSIVATIVTGVITGIRYKRFVLSTKIMFIVYNALNVISIIIIIISIILLNCGA